MKKRNQFRTVIVAGMLLLAPRLGGAHNGTGACVDCHTMHNSQNGDVVFSDGPQPQLLKYDCKGCHARTFNDANGRAANAGPYAPQVGSLAAGGPLNSGGYFSVSGGAADATTHNVFDLGAPADSLIIGTTAPGGAFALKSGANPVLTCGDCHDLSIGHAPVGSVRNGTANSSYRMLESNGIYVSGTGDSNYEASGAGKNTYNAASMNLFCATCHGFFHGLTNTDSVGDGSGAWIRHPSNVSTSYGGSYKEVPVGTVDGTGTDVDGASRVMCISCHRPHGNARADMLRFSYEGTGNLAGDAIASLGCETCHGMK